MPFVAGIAGRILLLAAVLVPSIARQNVARPPGRYAVIIVLDGSRPGYFNLTAMPNLRALQAHGVTYMQAFTGQELANTPPSHATIGTGELPRHNGVEGFLWEDPHTQRSRSAALQHAYAKLASTMASDAGPDVFVVFAPHVSTRQTVAYGYSWKAGHLGPQWGDQHIPLILSGPGIKQGVTSDYPARLVDIAPTVEHLLGAGTGSVDGVVLQDALTESSSERARLQQLRGDTFRPVVAALKHRSGYR